MHNLVSSLCLLCSMMIPLYSQTVLAQSRGSIGARTVSIFASASCCCCVKWFKLLWHQKLNPWYGTCFLQGLYGELNQNACGDYYFLSLFPRALAHVSPLPQRGRGAESHLGDLSWGAKVVTFTSNMLIRGQQRIVS
ncbi:hypothetical protein BGZ63DRAFT_242684 [Mariannaea sp. PMI_226]|nr:hypothetical protein BGZ63DRAFT_242684 [Mariannaea sp. PMI_226]